MAPEAVGDRQGLSFGPFSLVANERLLLRGETPVDLGGRALDILIALVAAPNEVVTKKILMAQVWPDVVVDEGSLRFHMTSLRKALGDGENGARYITTVPGRGYCFVAPIAKADERRTETLERASPTPHANLPARITRLLGRDEDIQQIAEQLVGSRLVTIVGAGGVGKTTLAIATAHHLADSFGGAAYFVDLGMVSDSNLTATAVASSLGLSVQTEDPAPVVIRHLKAKHALLIFDTCEHLVETVASLSATILQAAPLVHILATSREAIRVEEEHVYRLDALAYPAEDADLKAADLMQFPATQLFVERAAAGGARLEIDDTGAAIVSDICRKLDGVALAIELAARRVDSYGLEQTATLLDQRLTQLWHGLRTAPARQKTLRATLDWSYGLLSELERTVLRRLAIFVGHFTLDAALEVVIDGVVSRAVAFDAIDSLVEKSMLAVRPIGAMMRYRLLDTTRAYALELAADEEELSRLAGRHAMYYRHWLEQTASEWASLSSGVERAPYLAALNNVRTALEWSFGVGGDASIGVGLAAAAAPVMRAMALFPECQRWSERALGALDEGSRGGGEEMQLQASLGLSLMYMRGHSDPAIAALNRSLAIAVARGDQLNEVRLLGPLYFYHLRSGEFRTCLQYARRCSEIASIAENPAASALAHTLLGVTLTIMGDLSNARIELEHALETESPPAGREIYFGFDHYSWAVIAQLTALWLQGHPNQALAAIDQAFRTAEAMQHPVAHAIFLNAVAAMLWIGDLDIVEAHLKGFMARVESHSFAPYLHLGRAFESELAIRRGEIRSGVAGLQGNLAKLHAAKYELFTARLQIVLAGGLAACDRIDEASALIDRTERLIEAQGYTSYLPELLRLKGNILLSANEFNAAEAEACFVQSLELSRSQGSRTWELRTAMDLASLWSGQGKHLEAKGVLQPIFEAFTEGWETADLKMAEEALERLRRPMNETVGAG